MDKRGFAAAALAGEKHEFAGPDRQANVVQRLTAFGAAPARQPLRFQDSIH